MPQEPPRRAGFSISQIVACFFPQDSWTRQPCDLVQAALYLMNLAAGMVIRWLT